jgi:hypothetical protein
MRLLRCLEPIRDVAKQLHLISLLPANSRDKRIAKLLATPLYTVAEMTLSWLNTLSTEGSLNPRPNRQHRKDVRKLLELLKKSGIETSGDLAVVRHKIGAHVDKDAVTNPEKYWGKVDLSTFLDWTDLLTLVLAHTLVFDIFAWTKLDTPEYVWGLMSVDGTLVSLFLENGSPTMIIAVSLVESPKVAVLQELQSVQQLCRSLMPDHQPAKRLSVNCPPVVTSKGDVFVAGRR